ncbi:MAG TPA: hypothetical protein VFR29_11505 [Steroidobacteraceae bacterium]|nr:hypothetical protein [Steroidobacteraceae bacterium]
MNDDDPRIAGMDQRLRRLMSGLDARAGFEARVQDRIASLATSQTDLKAQFEARRLAARRRMRREAWANGVTTAGVGAAAAVLVWRFAPEIARFSGDVAGTVDPMVIGAATLAVVAAAVAPFLRKLPGWG